MKRSVGAILERVTGLGARWRGDRRGVSALEFCMIAPLLFLVVTAIIEIALITFSSGTLRTGVHHTARLVRVGTAQCYSDEEMVSAICSRSSFLPQCLNRLAIDRTVFPVGFSGAGVKDGAVSPSDVVLVGATYRWDVTTPALEPFFADKNGDFSFRQSFIFKTEEFISQACK